MKYSDPIGDANMSHVNSSKRSATRERILAIAERAVLDKGFSATSIEELLVAANISKSGFFYHFKDKNALALGLIHRYLAEDKILLDGLFARGDELSEDPLQAFLIGLKLFAEMMDAAPELHPGCLAASFCYQEQLFNAEIRGLARDSFLIWRKRFMERLVAIRAVHPPRVDVDLVALADMAAVVVDGAITLTKALKDRKILAAQVLLFRSYIRLLFDDSNRARSAQRSNSRDAVDSD